MKLYELKTLKEEEHNHWELDDDGYFVNGSGVVGWLYNMGILPENYRLDPETLEVELNRQSFMYRFKNSNEEDDKPMAKKLPIRIRSVAGSLSIDMPNLETLRGLPKSIGDSLILSDCNGLLKNGYEHWPESIGQTLMLPSDTRSLIGISKHVKELGYKLVGSAAQLYLNYVGIFEGGIELLQIESLRKTSSPRGHDADFEPFAIIEKYLGQPDKIFECQDELIEAGFEAYAKL